MGIIRLQSTLTLCEAIYIVDITMTNNKIDILQNLGVIVVISDELSKDNLLVAHRIDSCCSVIVY